MEHVLAAPTRLVRPASDELRRTGLAVLDAMSPDEGRLVLDVTHTQDADSVGIAALITLRRRAQERGLSVALRGVTPPFRALLRLAKVEARFEIEP